MANQEQLALLRTGVTEWNEWRQANPEEFIDLSEADLTAYTLGRARLRGANFRGSNLSGVDLMEADLQEAILVRANLQATLLNKVCLKEAYLYMACLKEAILIGADLEGADLEKANLEDALLYEANLKGAYLHAANLKGAKLRNAHLEGADLHEGHLEGADLQKAILGGNETSSFTDLRGVFFDDATNLRDITLGNIKHGFTRLADVHWSNVNLAVINWELVTMLGDEHDIHQGGYKGASRNVQLALFQGAIRANHQLVAILQDQAMLEEADYFAYRAQVLHRKLLQLQLLLQLERLWEKLQGTWMRRLLVRIGRWLQRIWIWKLAAQIGRWIQSSRLWRVVVAIGQGIHRAWQWFQTTRIWLLEFGSILRRGGGLIFAMFIGLLAGYGYKPERTFFWYVLVVFGFAVVYHKFYNTQPLDALILSLTSFHGRGFFPSILSGDPRVEPAAPIAVVEAVIGIMIEISFVATFTRRFFGK